MPTIWVEDGFRFFFYSNEGAPREPVHVHVEVHVEKRGAEAKFWLLPQITVDTMMDTMLARCAG